MIIKLIHPKKAAHLFGGWQETIIWSCLQGIMGAVYADGEEYPASAVAVLGDFCFLAGRPDERLLEYERGLFPAGEGFRILVSQTANWERLTDVIYCEL